MSNTIDILGIKYEIKEVPFESNPGGMGRWNEMLNVFYINKTLAKDQKDLTLWHEVTHCLLHALGEMELSRNEDFVEKLSRGLFNIADLKIIKNTDSNEQNNKKSEEQ